MAANEIHEGDIGTVLIVTVTDGTAVDISTATTKQIWLEAPCGTKSAKDADFVTDGTDGQIKYTTVEDDLDAIGYWKIQAYIVMPSGTWHSDVSEFQVFPNL